MFEKFRIAQAKEQLEILNKQISSKQQELIEIEHKINSAKQDLGICNGLIKLESLGIDYEPNPNPSDEILEKIDCTKREMANMVSQGRILIANINLTVNDSQSKGRQFQKAYGENLLMGFNAYFEKKKKAVTASNYQTSYDLINSKFVSLSKKAELIGMELNDHYLGLCLELLKLQLDYKINKAEEKERLKEEKRRLKEQEQLLAEAEAERKQLEAERMRLQKLFDEAIGEEEITKIKEKLAEVDARVADVDWRINHASAGWLYIAYTPAMPNILKIGCTKRLNPLIRLSELSSASVPYPFECKGLVFSDDVFSLEKAVHDYYDDKRVNVTNKHKEFFYVTPEEVIKILQEHFRVEVKFIDESWVD